MRLSDVAFHGSSKKCEQPLQKSSGQVTRKKQVRQICITPEAGELISQNYVKAFRNNIRAW
jgi:hypothetical protein